MAISEAWLRQCAADGQGGVRLPAVVRGEALQLVLRFPVDLSADTFTGALRLDPDAPDTLAVLTATKGEWDGARIPVTFTLAGPETAALPSDDDFDGLAEVAIALERNGRRFLGGVLPISGKV